MDSQVKVPREVCVVRRLVSAFLASECLQVHIHPHQQPRWHPITLMVYGQGAGCQGCILMLMTFALLASK